MGLLEIDYDAVRSAVDQINFIIGDGVMVDDYKNLFQSISELEGEQATAIRQLLKKEEKFVEQLDKTLGQFVRSLESAAEEFKAIDLAGSAILSLGRTQD